MIRVGLVITPGAMSVLRAPRPWPPAPTAMPSSSDAASASHVGGARHWRTLDRERGGIRLIGTGVALTLPGLSGPASVPPRPVPPDFSMAASALSAGPPGRPPP